MLVPLLLKGLSASAASLLFAAVLVLGMPEATVAARTQDATAVSLFIQSAQENNDQTEVTFPLQRGNSHGRPVWYVVTDSSDFDYARVHGINYSPKLANAKGSGAVQQVQIENSLVDFPATVDFGQQRVLEPGPLGFPPAAAKPAAIGEGSQAASAPVPAVQAPSIQMPTDAPGPSTYSPLIELPDGTVLNAPQVANATGQADKVVALDTAGGSVTYRETEGRYRGNVVHYVSFEASNAGAAAIEDVTYAPALGLAPLPDCNDPSCAREGLIAFTNGQTGVANPQRQGLGSALLDGLLPLNILGAVPENQADPGTPAYSPLWDVHEVAWTPAAIAAGQNSRQSDFDTVVALGASGEVVNFVTGQPQILSAGVVANCPAVSENVAP